MSEEKKTDPALYRLHPVDEEMVLRINTSTHPSTWVTAGEAWLLVQLRRWDELRRANARQRRSIIHYRLATLLQLAVTLVWLLAGGCSVELDTRDSCTSQHATPGCSSPNIEGCVCGVVGDHPCCALEWDDVCVQEAYTFCGACQTENDCATNACIDGTCATYEPQECDDCATLGCSGWTPLCDTSTRTCTLYCSADIDCAAVHEWTCDDVRGVCVWPCAEDGECTAGQQCIDGMCAFD